jgi:hypothetical protein
MSHIDENVWESDDPYAPPKAPLGETRAKVVDLSPLVIIALIVPVVAAVGLCFVTSVPVAYGVAIVAVLLSAALVAIDASHLKRFGADQKGGDSALMLFVGMCLLWVAVFPYAFFRRSRIVGPNLFVPSAVVAILFVGAPMLAALLIKPGLPSCTSPEVVALVDGMIRKSAVNITPKSIDGHREISYDRAREVRSGECIAHTDQGDIVVKYTVEWLDRDKGQYQVKIPPIGLPACTSPEVISLLESVIRKSVLNAKITSIEGHRELSYDRAQDRRTGQCNVHTDHGDLVIKYIVDWIDRDKARFQVGIPPAEPPACTSPDVTRLLEQVIRQTPVGKEARSIDGHRELSYDPATETRTGECTVHFANRNLAVKYTVKWRDRAKGEFEVRTLE